MTMLNKKMLIAVLALLLGVMGMATAQINKNAIYGNFGGTYQFGTGLHYERIILGGEYLHLTLGAGIGQSFNKADKPLAGGTYVPVNLGLAFGLKGHFLEMSAGPLGKLQMGIQEKKDFYAEPSLVGGQVNVGYKYFTRNKPGLFFKLYASGVFMSDKVAIDAKNTEAWLNGTLKAKMLPSLGLGLGLTF
jgi:hypothetical protein